MVVTQRHQREFPGAGEREHGRTVFPVSATRREEVSLSDTSQFVLYTLQLYIIHCTLYIVHYSLYIIHYIHNVYI